MSRDGGFAAADLDTSLESDPKMRRLRRIVGPELAAVAMLAYVLVVLASWREGRRLALEEAAPDWLEVPPGVGPGLYEAGLLDSEGRVPANAWRGWYGAAAERRGTQRDRWRRAQARRRTREAPDDGELDDEESPHRGVIAESSRSHRGVELAESSRSHRGVIAPVRPTVRPAALPAGTDVAFAGAGAREAPAALDDEPDREEPPDPGDEPLDGDPEPARSAGSAETFGEILARHGYVKPERTPGRPDAPRG